MRHLACVSALFLAALSTPGPALAALSGYYDSAEQIPALLLSPEIGEALSQQPVTRLQRGAPGEEGQILWQIGNEGCVLEARLIAVPPEGPGKTTYRLHHLSGCE